MGDFKYLVRGIFLASVLMISVGEENKEKAVGGSETKTSLRDPSPTFFDRIKDFARL